MKYCPLKFKPGVDLRGIQPEALAMVPVVVARFAEIGADYAMITSALDGKHSTQSLHYKGKALDWRIRHLKDGEAELVTKFIRLDLGQQFDVVLEKDHIHIEFDPK